MTATDLEEPADADRGAPGRPGEHPYADFLQSVVKPGRYLGGEHGQTDKAWDAATARICLAFPDVYEVGMSHLGFKILYSLVNGQPDLLAERAYAPWVDMEAELRKRGERLRSLESFHALSDFDIVGFSLQFELTYTNVLQMLELGGIPLRGAARELEHPLIVAGGPSATHAEPLAAFIDAFYVGDGEAATPELMRRWAVAKREARSRQDALASLAGIPGLYVPSLYETAIDPATGLHYVARARAEQAPLPVARAFVPDISQHPFPKDGPIATMETVFDRVAVEIARGCTEGCRFCQAGMIYRPVRERAPDEVVDVIGHAVREQGYDGASLTSLSTADYSAIAPLIASATDELKPQRATLSVSSLRAYGLAEDVLDDLKDSGSKGLTFAPEAGTQRMRDVVNKNVTEEQLMETARRVFSRGWSRMKLYFMIGLPTEEDADVRGVVQTGARALAVGRRIAGRGAKVTVNVSTHVPKPHTPFQWCAMDAREEVLRKQDVLKDEASRTGVTLRMHDSAGSWIEGVLARGDRTLGDVIEGAYRRGARFDSWDERLDLDAWNQAFAAAGIDPARFLGTLPVDARLPWDHIDVGLAPGFLAREYRKALKNRLSPPCGKAYGMFVHHTNLEDHEADQRKLVCYDCGVACDLSEMRAQRAQYLISLDAKTRREPARQAGGADATVATLEGDFKRNGARGNPRRKRPPIRPDQGAPRRVRLRFQKLGRAAFTSHLDLVRLLPRLLRRLSLPIYYSRGFHQKPMMTFGPALPLGVLSLCEYVDVQLIDGIPIDFGELPGRLNDASIDGLCFVEAVPLGPADAKISRVIDEAVYVAGIPRQVLAEAGLADMDALEAHVARRLQAELSVRRDISGIGKRIDVKRYLRGAETGVGAGALHAAGLVGDLVPLMLRIAITGGGSARASEALDAIFGEGALPARVVRSALLCAREGQRIDPLALAHLRRCPTELEDAPADEPEEASV